MLSIINKQHFFLEWHILILDGLNNHIYSIYLQEFICHWINSQINPHKGDHMNTAMQSQNAVSAYLESKQILPFGLV